MVQKAVTETSNKEGLRRRIEYQVGLHQKALTSLTRLAVIDVSEQQASDGDFAQAELVRAVGMLPAGSNNVEECEKATRLIPHRLFRGPLQTREHVRLLDEAGRDEWWELEQRIGKEASRTVPALAEYWADRQRTVAEIGQLIALETGLETTPVLVEYFGFMERLGLVELEERRNGTENLSRGD